MSYRKSHMDPGKGESYHDSFESESYRRMIWKLEKMYLDKILVKNYKNKKIRHLDFACGTGRLLGYVENKTSNSIGVDISSEMIQVARSNVASKIIEGDLTREDFLLEKKFDLITAFRFFPNAENDLRSDAINAISRHLDDKGLLVFNNHRNKKSFVAKLRRLVFRKKYRGMDRKEVELMLSTSHLKVVDTYSMGLFPDSYNKKIIPISMLYYIELILGKFKFFNGYGYNQIFVCRRLN
jgi:predicted TPR repeat methyltransferase